MSETKTDTTGTSASQASPSCAPLLGRSDSATELEGTLSSDRVLVCVGGMLCVWGGGLRGSEELSPTSTSEVKIMTQLLYVREESASTFLVYI